MISFKADALRNPKTTKEFRQQYQNSENFDHLFALLDNPSTESSILNNFAHKLMQHDPDIQLKLVNHPNATVFTLDMVIENSNSNGVKLAAEQRKLEMAA